MTRALLGALALAACGSSTTAPPPSPAPAPVVGKLVTSAEWMGPVREIRATGIAVPVAEIREVADAIGIPMSGTADIDISIDVPNAKPAQMTGHAHVTCTKCRLGGEHAKLHLGGSARANAFGGDGIEVGQIDFGRIEVAVSVANGLAEIDRWTVDSPDLAIEVTGRVELADPIGASKVTGCIRFKPSATLDKTSPQAFAVLSITGAPRGEDGFFSIALEGRVDGLRRLGKVCH